MLVGGIARLAVKGGFFFLLLAWPKRSKRSRLHLLEGPSLCPY